MLKLVSTQYVLEAPEVRMSLAMPPRAPDPAALSAYWAEYEDIYRQISGTTHNDDEENHYEDGEEIGGRNVVENLQEVLDISTSLRVWLPDMGYD
ncbi:unnamed protein product [Leptidea sinapis]|uniref:Uncharacterized protein n=1 Tax=Leptidea sinapis TaxID=189913 RepID=A0A5E4QWU0_9NEOP|nr:unnamed protein product [Leptidea sinapis]